MFARNYEAYRAATFPVPQGHSRVSKSDIAHIFLYHIILKKNAGYSRGQTLIIRSLPVRSVWTFAGQCDFQVSLSMRSRESMRLLVEESNPRMVYGYSYIPN